MVPAPCRTTKERPLSASPRASLRPADRCTRYLSRRRQPRTRRSRADGCGADGTSVRARRRLRAPLWLVLLSPARIEGRAARRATADRSKKEGEGESWHPARHVPGDGILEAVRAGAEVAPSRASDASSSPPRSPRPLASALANSVPTPSLTPPQTDDLTNFITPSIAHLSRNQRARRYARWSRAFLDPTIQSRQRPNETSSLARPIEMARDPPRCRIRTWSPRYGCDSSRHLPETGIGWPRS